MKTLLDYLVLPKERSEFEESYLQRINRISLWFFALHLPVFVLIAWANDTGPSTALVLTGLTLLGPIAATKLLQSRRVISTVMGITAMLMGGLLVHFGQGPVQIEMHFYFFVLLALLAVYANPMVIVAAAITAALHHAILWIVLPSSVFNYDAPFWVVAVHAAFVVLESVAACFIARSFFDNVIGLEKIVAQRTKELESRNDDMRLLLDSVEQGFLTFDVVGKMSEERSRYVEYLLGQSTTDSFCDLIRNHDPAAADWIEMGIDDVFAEILPVEVTLDQFPKRCKTEERTLSLQYNPVYRDGELTSIAVVISDISAEVKREALEVENREMLAMVDRIAVDRNGFLDFFQEAEGIIESLRNYADEDLVVLKRQLHTLKGNASIFRLERVARACHTIETYIAECGELPEGTEWTELFGSWATTRGNLRRLVNDVDQKYISLDDEEYQALFSEIIRFCSRDELAKRVTSWRLETTETRLYRMAERARDLATRLGKGEITTRIESQDLRLAPEAWAPFWSAFVHVIRNAIDHGIESPEDRRTNGKPESGTLTLQSTVEDRQFVISVSDDGQGIDWERVQEKAISLGHPAETQQDLVQALFQDGFSTNEEVNETSGRGVGMSAVRQACTELGGEISIHSTRGRGTTMRFTFPIRSMAASAIDELADHRISYPESVVLGQPRLGDEELVSI